MTTERCLNCADGNDCTGCRGDRGWEEILTFRFRAPGGNFIVSTTAPRVIVEAAVREFNEASNGETENIEDILQKKGYRSWTSTWMGELEGT